MKGYITSALYPIWEDDTINEMTDWPFLECLENKEEFIEKLKKKGLVKRNWKPPKKNKIRKEGKGNV